MLYIFDLDDTLVESYSSTPKAGVAEKLSALAAAGHAIAVATNQAGVAWGRWTRKTKYPTVASLSEQFHATVENLPPLREALWLVAIHDKRVRLSTAKFAGIAKDLMQATVPLALQASAAANWRKPGAGMLLAACQYYAIPPEEAIFIGDMESDAEAAAEAGITFVYAGDFIPVKQCLDAD